VETASKRLIFQVVISDDQGNFELGKDGCAQNRRVVIKVLA